MKAADWIDRVKAQRGWDSDYRVAKELGVSKATVSAYRTRTQTLDEGVAMKVASQLEIDPIIVLVDQAAERARDDEARQALTGLLRRIGGAVSAVALAVGLVTPPPANAHEPGAARVWIMSSALRRIADALRALVARAGSPGLMPA